MGPNCLIIEIGCAEVFNRRFTENAFHRYLNPERDIDLVSAECDRAVWTVWSRL